MKMIKLAALAGLVSFVQIAAAESVRPYEFDWANRKADEFPVLCRLESADGWQLTTEECVAKVETARERALFGDGVVRLTYRATGKKPVMRLRPPKPLKVEDGFDTVTLWVWGNNLWGREKFAGKRQIPSLAVIAEFADENGKPFRVSLGKERHYEWFLMTGIVRENGHLSPAPKGLSFVGFAFENGTNDYDLSIELTSLSVFKDPKRPLNFAARPKRGVQLFPEQPQGLNTGAGVLPFPTSARTMLPPERELSGKLEFRLPKDPLVWDDLAFRYDGSDWMPLAIGGGVFPREKAAGAKVTFHRIGNSLVCDVVCPEPGIESVRFGGAKLPADAKKVTWPFYTLRGMSQWDCPCYPEKFSGGNRPCTAFFKVGSRQLIVGAQLDWTQSNASAPIGKCDTSEGCVHLNGGTVYLPKTDGKLNGCFERFVWTFAEKAADVFPTIPNPPSPYRRETAAGSWVSFHAKDREADSAYWRAAKAAGFDHIIITDHEAGWRDSYESFTFRTNSAPKKGGDEGQRKYARLLIDELGYRYGLYNNYTDYAPVNENWSLDYAARNPDGSIPEAWVRCYKPKPTWVIGMCEKLIPVIQSKFHLTTSYCDVHTCVSPWNRTDYDARSPGAGTFAQTYYVYGEIMQIQRRTWQGPVYSEGCIQWIYSGLTDGNYGQDDGYDFGAAPWLVDFDVVRMHPQENTFGMGEPGMFYIKTNKDLVEKESDLWCDRFTAATLAFGHTGFFYSKHNPKDFSFERRFYYPVQAIATRYGVSTATEIRYGSAEGKMLDTETAIFSGAVARNQVRVTYADGTQVAANGSMTESFSTTVCGDSVVIPPNGWYARTADGSILTYCLERDGRREHYSKSPEYEQRW